MFYRPYIPAFVGKAGIRPKNVCDVEITREHRQFFPKFCSWSGRDWHQSLPLVQCLDRSHEWEESAPSLCFAAEFWVFSGESVDDFNRRRSWVLEGRWNLHFYLQTVPRRCISTPRETVAHKRAGALHGRISGTTRFNSASATYKQATCVNKAMHSNLQLGCRRSISIECYS